MIHIDSVLDNKENDGEINTDAQKQDGGESEHGPDQEAISVGERSWPRRQSGSTLEGFCTFVAFPDMLTISSCSMFPNCPF